MVILGSHNSCTYKLNSFNLLLPWCKTQELSLIEQYNYGCRYFDLRYNYGDYISHTFNTVYTLKKALNDITMCSINDIKKDNVIIRLKRDTRIKYNNNIKKLNFIISNIKIGNKLFTDYILKNKNNINPWNNLNTKTPIILYCDDNSCILDGLKKKFIFGQIFNTVETWNYLSISKVIQKINTLPFKKNNIYPKALFIDYSGCCPPLLSSSYILYKTKKKLLKHIKNKKIDYLIINNTQDFYENKYYKKVILIFICIYSFFLLFILFIIIKKNILHKI